jgi:hypothetical protein
MATCADVAPISAALSILTLGEPVHAGAVTVVPLLVPSADEPDWLTLAEAGDRVVVTEVSEAGSVPSLSVNNHADRPVLLLDGEELVGSKQNRVLNTTVLVAAGASVTIPVSCVEQGRWAWRSRRFVPGDVSLFASERRKKSGRVTQSLRRRRVHDAGQREVWDAVASKARSLRVDSATGAVHDIYAARGREIEDARARLAPRPRQVGASVYVAGAWAGLELLAGPGLFARAWPRLAAGYIADALGFDAVPVADGALESVLARVARASVASAPAVGGGDELRLEGGEVVGAALLVDGRVAHLMAFPEPEPTA